MQRDGGPGGAGGAGNPTGGSFTGPAETLELVGNHAYAYSGLFAASGSEQTALSFTTGNYYLVGFIQVNGAVDDDAPENVTLTSLRVAFNGTNLFILVTGVSDILGDVSARQAIVIPQYTDVVATLDNQSTAADQYASVILTGRIYRG